MKICKICRTEFPSKGRSLTCSELCSKRLKQQRDKGFTLTFPRPIGSLRLWVNSRFNDNTHVGVFNRDDDHFYTLCGSRASALTAARYPRITCEECKAEFERLYPGKRPVFWRR